MALTPKNIALATFKSTGSTTKRTWADRSADVINVRDYGAVANGTANDAPAIQLAFNAAFTTSGTPHGETNKHLNKPVFFPSGTYAVFAPGTTTAAGACLTLPPVSGGRLYSPGCSLVYGSNLGGSGARNVTVLKTNGMVDTWFEGFEFKANSGAETGALGFDLDWDGSTTYGVGLNSNKFTGCQFIVGSDVGGITTATGIRIANSNHEGHDNVFWRCLVHDIGNRRTASVGFKVNGTSAFNQNFVQSAGSDVGIIYQVNGGSISSIIWGSWAQTDGGIELNTASTTVLIGLRAENANILRLTVSGSKLYCASGDLAGAIGYMAQMVTGSTLILDAVQFGVGDISGNGSLYLRASTQSTLSFTGTIVQNI